MIAEVKDGYGGRSQENIKVRKAYTITKQREKWSEAEHQRFVEALKLYGRAWRQIEEHVGSKTAIQIRSHAQKFFAKLTKDSSLIQIPPPRPKKKPRNNLEYRVAEMHQSRLSPSSCTTDALSSNIFRKNDKEEDGFHISSDTKSTMTQQTESTLDSPYSSIKLFGKTVVVRDAPKQYLDVADNSEAESNSDNFGFVSEKNMFALPCYTWYPYPLHGKESLKGFGPYKRCLGERDDKSSISGRRARVCS